MTDLLSALAPPPAEATRPRGLIDGPPGWHEGLCAGLRCWCGPVVGWRDLGELVGGPDCERVVVHQHGRLMVGGNPLPTPKGSSRGRLRPARRETGCGQRRKAGSIAREARRAMCPPHT